MKNKLPPLNAVRAFEVTGRLESFSKAAEELSITHSAVSHQIKALEDWFGVRLFHRAGKKLNLTEQGRTFLASVSPALAAISNASSRLTCQRMVRVNALPTLTMRWLIPRLASFRTLHPGIEISLATGLGPASAIQDDYDVVIRREPDAASGIAKRQFLPEVNFPVCAPSVITASPIISIADLRNHTLIHSAARPTAWPEWLRHVGQPSTAPSASLHLEHLYFALQAALDGLGIAIGQSAFVSEDIANGRLVMPFGRQMMPCRGYYMIWREDRYDEAIQSFCDWLEQEGKSFEQDLSHILNNANQLSLFR
ncbi:transcriptional regulator GcvA [Stutzerimonas azotifigens]|uniref:transcriptional regulator GcvA n=1 Tax=Stutzerimonas azotifigens TaxID=291995 RepID=UPI0005B7F295|nr:transcriptional regulator GcvA [Stutzerimonas azotifigens]